MKGEWYTVNGKRLRRWLWWLPAVFMMIVIFWFSSKTGLESDGTSNPVATAILNLIECIFGEFDVNQHELWQEQLNFIVRKAAHMIEYAVLAMMIGLGCFQNLLRGRWMLLLPFFGSAVYAATDEIHQLFVEGRSGKITDVFIDSVGSLIGCLFVFIIVRAVKKKSTQSTKQTDCVRNHNNNR